MGNNIPPNKPQETVFKHEKREGRRGGEGGKKTVIK